MKYLYWVLVTLGSLVAQANESLRLGNDLVRDGHYEEALPLLRQAVVNAESQSPLLPEALKLLGLANQRLGRLDEAERYYRRAVGCFSLSVQPDSRLAGVWTNLLSLYLEQNRMPAAESIAMRLAGLPLEEILADPDDLRHLYTTLAGYYALREDLVRAEANLMRAFGIAGGQSTEQEAAILNNLGTIAAAAGRGVQAVTYLERAVVSLESSGGSRHPALTKVLVNLSEAYRMAGRPDGAESALDKALLIADEQLTPIDPRRADILSAQAGLLRERGAKDLAKKLEAQAKEIRKRWLAEGDPRRTVDISELKRNR